MQLDPVLFVFTASLLASQKLPFVFPLRHAGEIEVNRIITLLYSVYCKLVGSTNSLM